MIREGEGFVPPQEDKVEIEVAVTTIPENLTKDKLLALTKMQDGKETRTQIVGALLNGPIEVGKSVVLAMGNTSEVKSIVTSGSAYLIRTETGSEYMFNPAQALEKLDDSK